MAHEVGAAERVDRPKGATAAHASRRHLGAQLQLVPPRAPEADHHQLDRAGEGELAIGKPELLRARLRSTTTGPQHNQRASVGRSAQRRGARCARLAVGADLAQVLHRHLRRHVVLDLDVEEAGDVAAKGGGASPVDGADHRRLDPRGGAGHALDGKVREAEEEAEVDANLLKRVHWELPL